MAIERNMAEGTSGVGSEGSSVGSPVGSAEAEGSKEANAQVSPTPGVSPSTEAVRQAGYIEPQVVGQVSESVKIMQEIKNQLGAKPEWLREVKESRQSTGFTDRFSALVEANRNYGELNRVGPAVPPEHRDEFNEILRQGRELVDSRTVELNGLIFEAFNAGALDRVRSDLKTLYRDLKTNADLRAQPLNDRIRHLHEIGRMYQETFWEFDTESRRLRGRYEGTGSYLFQRVCLAIEKDLRGIDLSSAEIGDLVFMGIKEERNRERMKEPKFQPERGGWRMEFHWAEDEDDIIPSVQDWLQATIKEIPKSRRDKKHEYLELKQRDGLDMLSRLRIRLEKEGHDIAPDNPTYVRAKTLMESQLNILGGERALYRGGFDYYINYFDNFANDFTTKELNGHYDVVYLSDEMIPLMLDQLSAENGKYWRGCEDTEEKPSEERIKAFQAKRQGEIERYAVTHRLFINKADFKNRAIGFEDKIGKLLLDSDNEAERLEQTGDPALAAKAANIRLRRGVFRRTRDRLDAKEGLYSTAGLSGLTEEQRETTIKQLREQAIRKIVIDQMHKVLKNNTLEQRTKDAMAQMEEARGNNDVGSYDRALWQWVEDYNRQNRENDQPEWFPSKWDKVRLKLNEPEKLLARSLTQKERASMYIETDDSGYTKEEISAIEDQIKQTPDTTAEQIQRRLEDFKSDLKARKDDRLAKARNNFTLARGTQIFFGLASRYGGTRIRHVDDYGKFESFTPVFVEFRNRLKKMIDDEAAEIQAGQLKKEDAVFLTTHAFREKGLAQNLPIWSFNMVGDEATIEAVAQALAHYGVRIGSGPGVPLSHDDKGQLYDIFERARRAMKAVKDDLAKEVMDGRFIMTDDNGVAILELNEEGKPRLDAKGKPMPVMRRTRLNHKGGNIDLRRIFDAQYITSTSGGVATPEIISRVADLGVYDFAWEMGCEDLGDLSSFIYTENGVETGDPSFFDVMDAPNYKDRLAGAEMARKFLTAREYGGLIKGQGIIGLFQETFNGAYRLRQFMLDENKWIAKKRPFDLKDFTPDKLDAMLPEFRDELTKLVGDVLKPLLDYMRSRDYVANRLGRATRAWEYDNTLIWYAFRDFVRGSIGKGKNEHILAEGKLAYAPQSRTEPLLKFTQGILEASLYYILFEEERANLVKEGMPLKKQIDPLRANLQELEAQKAKLIQTGSPIIDIQKQIKAKEGQIRDLKLKNHRQAAALYFADAEPQLVA